MSVRMEETAEDSFAAMRARSRLGIAIAAIISIIATTIKSSISENPRSFDISAAPRAVMSHSVPVKRGACRGPTQLLTVSHRKNRDWRDAQEQSPGPLGGIVDSICHSEWQFARVRKHRRTASEVRKVLIEWVLVAPDWTTEKNIRRMI